MRAVVAEATEVGQDMVQGLTLDELHGVVADPALRPVIEDADDIRVVQPGRQAGLGVEPAQVFRVGPESRVHDLERHPALERLVLGLIDHPHPAAADASEDDVVAQPLGRRALVAGFARMVPMPRGRDEVAGRSADLLQLDQGRDQLAYSPGQVGMLCDQIRQRRPLSASEPGQEGLDDRTQRIVVRRRCRSVVHGQSS